MGESAQSARRKTVSFEVFEPVAPSYLWEPYLIRANLNLIFGDGGTGKSALVAAVFAALTAGRQPVGMPGMIPPEPCNVLYLGAEDDPEAIRYRLDRCGCDPARVFTVPLGDMPNLANTAAIRQCIEETGARLVAIDPVQALLPPRTDMNNAADIRPLLDGLRAVCRETDCTGLLVAHANKNSQQTRAVYRAAGSSDFVNACRSALLVGYGNGARVAIQVKTNARFGQPFAFDIDAAGGLCWLGTCNIDEEEVLNTSRSKSARAEPADPVFELVCALVAANPDGWQGTASQMLAQGAGLVHRLGITDPRAVGRSLPGIADKLRAAGIEWRRRTRDGKSIHEFFPRETSEEA